MRLQTNAPVVNFVFAFHAARPSCPRCGDSLLAPEIAEFVGVGRIRHTWVCDECDHVFCTNVEVDPD